MAQVTRLGLYGCTRSPYGSFAGKVEAGALRVYTITFTRLGLNATPRSPYGSFTGKGVGVGGIISIAGEGGLAGPGGTAGPSGGIVG